MRRGENGSDQFSLDFHRGYGKASTSGNTTSCSGNVVRLVDRQTSSTRNDAVRRAKSNGIFSSFSDKR